MRNAAAPTAGNAGRRPRTQTHDQHGAVLRSGRPPTGEPRDRRRRRCGSSGSACRWTSAAGRCGQTGGARPGRARRRIRCATGSAAVGPAGEVEQRQHRVVAHRFGCEAPRRHLGSHRGGEVVEGGRGPDSHGSAPAQGYADTSCTTHGVTRVLGARRSTYPDRSSSAWIRLQVPHWAHPVDVVHEVPADVERHEHEAGGAHLWWTLCVVSRQWIRALHATVLGDRPQPVDDTPDGQIRQEPEQPVHPRVPDGDRYCDQDELHADDAPSLRTRRAGGCARLAGGS